MKIAWIHGKLYLRKYGQGTLILEIFQLIQIQSNETAVWSVYEVK